MSLDTELFSSRPIPLKDLRQSLPGRTRWHHYGGGELAYEADGWQLLVGVSEAVDPADVPADLAAEEAMTFMAAAVTAVGQMYGCAGYDLRTGAPVVYTSRLSR